MDALAQVKRNSALYQGSLPTGLLPPSIRFGSGASLRSSVAAMSIPLRPVNLPRPRRRASSTVNNSMHQTRSLAAVILMQQSDCRESLLPQPRCRDVPEILAGTVSLLVLAAFAFAAAIPLLLPLMLLVPAFWCKRYRMPPLVRHGQRGAKRKLRKHHVPLNVGGLNGEQSGTDYNSTVAFKGRTFHYELSAAIQACSKQLEDQTMRASTQHDVESMSLLPDFGHPAADAAAPSCRFGGRLRQHRNIGTSIIESMRCSSVEARSGMKPATEFKLGTQLSMFDFDVIRACGPCFMIKINRHSAVPFYMRFRWAGHRAIAAAAWQPAADIAGTTIAETGEDLGCVVTGTHGKHMTWFNALYRMPRSFTRFCIMSFLLSQVDAHSEQDPGHFMNKKHTADQTEKFVSNNLLSIGGLSLRTISWISLVLCSFLVVILMFQGRQQQGGGNGGRGGGRRDPPKWSPDLQTSYPYHVWLKDLMTWSLIVSDLELSSQTAMVIMGLDGAAREIAR